MDCDKTGPLIMPYVDAQLSGWQALRVGRHLRGCASCAARHRDLVQLRNSVQALPRFGAPPALTARLRALAAEAPARAAPRRPAPARRWFLSGALAGCVATLTAWLAAGTLLEWRNGRDLIAQAVASHVQAGLSQHLTDVASTDQHSVKPWLSARLDYSPPVPDMTADGFTLIGGRLTILNGRRVAALVYRYGEHTIDVFVQPQPSDLPALQRTLRGFNVAGAHGATMAFLAVSDVNDAVLAQFAQRLARADAQDPR